MQFRLMIILFVIAFTNFVQIGCSSNGQGNLAVTGLVNLDGKPSPGVRVNFWPAKDRDKDSRDRYASGLTGTDGRFTLQSISDKGVPPGEYKVTFSRSVAQGKVSTDPKSKMNGTRESLLPKYVDQDKTEILASVTKEKIDFVFDLSSK